MEPNAVDPQEAGRPGRPLPGFSSRLSKRVKKVVIAVTEPLSPSRSEFTFGSAPSTPGAAEKLPASSTSPKSADDGGLITANELAPRQPMTLVTLPPELQIAVISFLGFADIQRLRRTSKYWYNFATPRLVRSIYGPDTFRAMLIQHCCICLTYCPQQVHRLFSSRLDAGWPLSSRCVKCTVQSKDGTIRFGKKVTLGNFIDYWTCRWCGWPVTGDSPTGHAQFHRRCYDKYATVLLAFFFLGWIQLTIGVVAAALVWHYFPHDTAVLVSTIIGFVWMCVCIVLIMFRGNKVRTYHWALLIELIIVGLWILPCHYIADEFAHKDLSVSKRVALTTLAFIALNMLFRLLNIIGNVVLIFEYDRTKHYVPRIPIWRRFVNPIMTALIFWTYPQHTERKYPPDWS